MREVKNALIVDDHSIVTLGVKLMISELVETARIWEAFTLREAIALTTKHKFDLIVLDINIDGGGHFQMVRPIRKNQPDALILIFSTNDEKVHALSYVQSGANGYLSKSAAEPECKQAIAELLSTGRYVSEPVKEYWVYHIVNNNLDLITLYKRLSPKEEEVMKLLIAGKSNGEISKILKLKSSTVGSTKVRIFAKLGVKNVVELASKMSHLIAD